MSDSLPSNRIEPAGCPERPWSHLQAVVEAETDWGNSTRGFVHDHRNDAWTATMRLPLDLEALRLEFAFPGHIEVGEGDGRSWVRDRRNRVEVTGRGASGTTRRPAPAGDQQAYEGEPPTGAEINLRCHPVPEQLADLAAVGVAAAKRAGARRAVSAWATGAGRAGLWIAVDAAPDSALVAAEQALALQAGNTPVRVLRTRSLGRQAQQRLVRGLSRQDDASPEPVRLFPGANTVIGVVCLLGALLVALGREAAGTRGTVLEVAGWAVEAGLVLAVLAGAAGRGALSRGSARPLALLVGTLVAAGLVYQALRGLR